VAFCTSRVPFFLAKQSDDFVGVRSSKQSILPRLTLKVADLSTASACDRKKSGIRPGDILVFRRFQSHFEQIVFRIANKKCVSGVAKISPELVNPTVTLFQTVFVVKSESCEEQ